MKLLNEIQELIFRRDRCRCPCPFLAAKFEPHAFRRQGRVIPDPLLGEQSKPEGVCMRMCVACACTLNLGFFYLAAADYSFHFTSYFLHHYACRAWTFLTTI